MTNALSTANPAEVAFWADWTDATSERRPSRSHVPYFPTPGVGNIDLIVGTGDAGIRLPSPPGVSPAHVRRWAQQLLCEYFSRNWTTAGGDFCADELAEEAATAGAIRRVRDRSGLTWEEVAQLFAVSRRAVHNWASGGRLSSSNAARLEAVSRLVDEHDRGIPELTRAALLAPQADGVSAYQRAVRQAYAHRQVDQPWHPLDLLGARDDGDEDTGTVVGTQSLEWPGASE